METKLCQLCNEQFPCGALQGKCWCMDMPVVPPLPAAVSDCICESCLVKLSKEASTPKALIENEDYYLENGFTVFTAHYLLTRGYCCNSGCRHCPYPKK